MTRTSQMLTGWLLLALACHLAHGVQHAHQHVHVDGLPPASGQQEAHGGDCHHGVDVSHHAHADCLACSQRTADTAAHEVERLVVNGPWPELAAASAEAPALPARNGGVLGARGPPALAG